MKPKSGVPWPLIEAGQVWQMNETTCRIGQVGKRLVHYKMFKGKPTHVAPILTDKDVLTKHLKAKKAVLVQG